MTDKVLRYYNCANYCGNRFAEIEQYNNSCKSDKDKIKFLPRRCWDNCMSQTKTYKSIDFEKIHKEKYSCCEKQQKQINQLNSFQ